MKQEIIFLKKKRKNKLVSKKHKNVCTNINCIEHFLILAPTITGCISIYAFDSLLGIPIKITSFPIGLTVFAIAAGFEKEKEKEA